MSDHVISDSVTVQFGKQYKKNSGTLPVPSSQPKQGALSGATGALAATQPWLAIGVGLFQLGSNIYREKKEKKAAQEKANKDKIIQDRIDSITSTLTTFAGNISDSEKIFWNALLGYIAGYFYSEILPITDEFLWAMHRRIAMGSLSSGRSNVAGIFFSLPYLFSVDGRKDIGIVLLDHNKKFLYYFQTPDIGIPAQRYDLDVPWEQGTTAEKYMPMEFPKDLKKEQVGYAYIVPSNMSKDEIRNAKGGLFENTYFGYTRAEDGAIIIDLSYGQYQTGMSSKISEAIVDIYSDFKAEETQKKLAIELAADPDTYSPYQEYDYSYPMILFTPHIEIKDNSVVLNWYEQFNVNFFQDKLARSTMDDDVVKILLYEKGFLKEFTDFKDITPTDYKSALNKFRVAHNLASLDVTYLDKITESVLRGRKNQSRNWNAYNWDIDASNSTNYDLSGNTAKIRTVSLPIQEGEKVGVIGEAQPIPNSNVAKVHYEYGTRSGSTGTTVIVELGVGENYKIIGYTASFKNNPSTIATEFSCNTKRFMAKGYLGKKEDFNFYIDLYVQKIIPLADATIVSETFFPVVKDLDELDVHYVKVRDFVPYGQDSDWIDIELQASNNPFFIHNVSEGKIVQVFGKDVAINSSPNTPKPVASGMLFFRWLCTLRSRGGNISPLLMSIGVDFGQKQYTTVSLKNNIAGIKLKLDSINSLIKQYGDYPKIPPNLLSVMRVKQFVLSSEYTALQNRWNWLDSEVTQLLAQSKFMGITPTQRELLDGYAEEIGREVVYDDIDIIPDIKEIEMFLSTTIEEAKQQLLNIVNDFNNNVYGRGEQLVLNSGATRQLLGEAIKGSTRITALADQIVAGIANAMEAIGKLSYLIDVPAEFKKLSNLSLPEIDKTKKALKSLIAAEINKNKTLISYTILMIMTDISQKSSTFWSMIVESLGLVKPSPEVLEFSVSPAMIKPGDPCILTWKTVFADEVWVGGQKKSQSSGNIKLTPEATIQYGIRAIGSGKAVEKIARIVVSDVMVSSDSPTIVSFTASPLTIAGGQSTMLTWDVKNAEKIEINGVHHTGNSLNVSPIRNTTYMLVAINKGNAVSKSITVVVNTGQGVTPPVQPEKTSNIIPVLAIGAVLFTVLTPKGKR